MSDCAICLQSVDDSHKKKLDCDCVYIYHTDCIDQWLKDHPSCPTCRKSFSIPRPPPRTVLAVSPPPSTNNVNQPRFLRVNTDEVVPYNTPGLARASGSLGFAPYN